MTMALWADYSAGRPSGAAFKAAGFDGVLRYVGLGSGNKRINAAEYADLAAAGVDVLLVAELGTNDAWGNTVDDDYGRGITNATIARQDARAAGIPDWVGIAAAADAHAVNGQQITDAIAYTRGFRDVLGLDRTGFYGFSETLNAVHDAGVASWFWRCGSKPSDADQSWVHFWQRNAAPSTRVVGGVVCDINEQYNPVGAVAPSISKTTVQEDDMITVPPGKDDHSDLIVKGRTELYVACSFGQHVAVHSIDFFGATGVDLAGTGVGGRIENVEIDPNRPGPLPVPKGAVMATMRYTADHSFGVGVA